MVDRAPDQLTTYLRYLVRESELDCAALEDTQVVTVWFGAAPRTSTCRGSTSR